MIFVKNKLTNYTIKKSWKNFFLKAISQKFSNIRMNLDNDFLKKRNFNLISKQESNFEFKLKNLEDKNFVLNLLDSNIKQKDNIKDDTDLFDELFKIEFIEEENKLKIENKEELLLFSENKDFKLEINLYNHSNLFFKIDNSDNIIINSDSIQNNNDNNLFKSIDNLKKLEIDSTNSKIIFNKDLIYSNIKISALNSFIKCNGLFSNKRALKANFINFEEAFAKKDIKELEENKNNNSLDNKNRVNKELSITLQKSKIEIGKIQNYNKFILRTNTNISSNTDNNQNPLDNSEIKFGFIEVKNFDFELNEHDRLDMNLYHLFENSLFKMKNINFNETSIKIHPILFFNLNIYNTNKGKFQKNLFFDNEGYSFCPTIVFDIDKEFPKNYLVGYNLIKIPKSLKLFFISLLALFLIKILILSNNNLNNCKDNETSLNTLNNLPKEYSEYKFYQLAMKAKFNKLLNNIGE